ncbi:ATP-binding cassette domain-containing protein [Paenibacillus dendritiformis]|uniref:ATP-binding cassette domain-containing protein n=1 Tax=Paenibacillus dendritiformis TaxID=130049 RepID=UPI0018CF2438|nr:ABC transporter ATP-binding protein [Paenibacillus dendritiformis]
MNIEPVIVLKDVVKRRERLQIGPLNIQLPQGCVTAIVGTNGAGKSTLMGMFMGFIKPDSGTVALFQETYQPEPDTSVKARIGYVAESPNSEEDDLTAEAAAAFSAYWYERWDWRLYHHLMARYDIPPKTKLKKLSKGMRRKLDLILAICPRPDLLLLDEPSSGFDPLSWRMMIDDLNSYLEEGRRSIVIATHIIEEVKRLADYVLFLHQGQVLLVIEKDALFDAWKEFWLEGEAEDYAGVPGVVKAIQERHGVRLIASQADRVDAFLAENGIIPRQTAGIELDDILAYVIELNQEVRGE